MKKRERLIWIVIVVFILIVTTASGLHHWIFAKDNDKTYEQLRLFNEVFNLLRTEYYDPKKASTENLINGAIGGMIKSLDDPHTSFLDKELFNELQTDTNAQFGGLGIVIGIRDSWITVIAPIDDTPASRVGIKAGDKIIEIEGKSTEGYTTMDAVRLLRGKVGTKVNITVKRESVKKPLHFTITRGLIKIETVKSELIDNHIGYVRISQFSEPTPEAFMSHVLKLKDQGANSFIIDLRNNPGGLLSSVIQIADMLLDHGIIVSTKGRDPKDYKVYKARKGSLVDDMPIIIMINGGSASASEILSGAIKDNHRGILVGTKSYGKGSVQTVRRLPSDVGIRITTALYYTPSGKSIDKIGIKPDEMVKSVEITEDDMKKIKTIDEKKIIKGFLERHALPTDRDYNGLYNLLEKDKLSLKPIIVRRLVKNELESNKIPSLVDLNYDVQLRHAVNMLKVVGTLLKKKAS